FLPASKAHELLARWRRAGSYLLEELFEGHLEKECFEEVCVYEEAREVFEHGESTVRIPATHAPALRLLCRLRGRALPERLNEGTYSPKNECHPLRLDGCQHFCHPGPESYTCSCARGHKLGGDHRSCLPLDSCACGTLGSECCQRPQRSQQNLPPFPWQVKLTNSEGKDFCGGVLIQDNFVLTTAKCSLLYRNISVKT
ncbi:hypothetical protein Celaphus_00016843, partial [Cervus elaphus hippelaphus]